MSAIRLSLHRTFVLYIPAMASSVDSKLLKSTKFPPEFSQKVDMTKVNVEVMKKFVRSQSEGPGAINVLTD